MNTSQKDNILNVYYDGFCMLCSREIEHYKKQKGSDAIMFTDITSQNFDPIKEGVDPVLVHKIMHVKNSRGELRTGVDAFIEIWEHLPKYKKMAKLAKKSPIKKALNFGYQVFAILRPYLPRKSNECETSPYCERKIK